MNLERYSRQIVFSKIGAEGQRRLQKGKVVIVGCGALGSGSANILARAGVGFLKICDRDFVDLSNLQRQTLLDEQDVKEKLPKAQAIAKKIKAINSEIYVEPLVVDINAKNVEEIIEGADIVLDGTDNFETRFLLNDACLEKNIPWIYGGCVASYGMVMTIIPSITPCLRCILDTLPKCGSTPTCRDLGIVNTIPNIVSAIQCNEAIKFLTGNLDEMLSGLVAMDIWANSFKILKVEKNNNCPSCALRKDDLLLK